MSPLITEVQVKRSGVAAVSLDGDDQPVVLPLETVVLHHLRRGADVPASDWRTARAEGRRLLAVRRALEILARSQKTERELSKALARSFEPDEVTHAVQRMRSLGYLDDQAWAKRYVASLRATDRGRALLKQELGQRGVPDAMARAAVAEHDDAAAARRAADRRAPSLRRVEEPKRTRRLYDFLRRRGFADGIAREAAAQALAALGAERDSDGQPED